MAYHIYLQNISRMQRYTQALKPEIGVDVHVVLLFLVTIYVARKEERCSLGPKSFTNPQRRCPLA